ncbi:MAG: hypothetical protein PHU85_18090 [Phycisphaerae bacterium]|nr:hypothetical protein [Phycisphaerae bacterium]
MAERQENFPIGTFRYLDGLLSDVRVAVSRRAAELAGDENPDSLAYRVSCKHVTAAWKEHRHAQTLLDIAERDRTYRKLDFASEQGRELVKQNKRLTAELAEVSDCDHSEDDGACGDCNACLELRWMRELDLRRKRDAELAEARKELASERQAFGRLADQAQIERLPCCKGRERPEPTYAAVVVALREISSEPLYPIAGPIGLIPSCQVCAKLTQIAEQALADVGDLLTAEERKAIEDTRNILRTKPHPCPTAALNSLIETVDRLAPKPTE